MSGWLLLGLPAAAFWSGLSAAWIAIGLALGTYFNWKLVAVRLRKFTYVADDSAATPPPPSAPARSSSSMSSTSTTSWR